MRQGKSFVGQLKKSSFLIIRCLMVLFTCTYCEEDKNSFDLSKIGNRSLNSLGLGEQDLQIIINNGDLYTKEKEVILILIPSKDADEMFLSFDSNCSKGTWEPLQTKKSINLRDLNQESFVYVMYRFLGEEETACVGDSIIHDNILPDVDFVNPPNPWIADRNLSIGIETSDSGSGVKSIQCDRQGDGEFESCGQSVVYNSLVENQNHLLVVKVEDKAGNFSEPKQVNWRSDQSSPSLTVSLGPSALTADTTPDFSFLTIDTGSGISHLECRVDSASQFSPCQSEFNLSNLSDGAHRIEVKTVDRVGRFSNPVVYTWTQDTTVPTVHFTSKPSLISNANTADFTFSGVNEQQGIVSYHCRLDNGALETCSTFKSISGLSDGEHAFSVVGRDAVGHESSPIVYRWVVDRSKPTLRLVDKPNQKSRFDRAHFVLQARDSVSGIQEVQCKLDNGSYGVCPSPYEVNSLSEGSHRFLAKSIDKAGNESEELSYEWLIDKTKPTVTITSGPDNPTNNKKTSFVFNSSDSGSGIDRTECRLDGRAFRVCVSPEKQEVPEGDHIFSVRVFDQAGNVSQIQTYNWSIDVTGPSIEWTQKPDSITSSQTAQFAFSGVNNDPVSSYECEFDGNSQSCTGASVNLTGLSDGSHNFKVTGLDALGNKSEPLSYTWIVDATRPTLSFVENPASLSNSNQGRFQFNAQDEGGSGIKEIRCKVDQQNYQICQNPMSASNLADGSHTLMAYSVDNVGNESEIQTYSWSVDTTASNIKFTSKPDAITRTQSATFTFSETGGQNDIKSYECQLDGGSAQSCTSPKALSSLSDGEHTFTVIGLDSVNNRSAAISYTWRVDTTKPTLSFGLKPDAITNVNEAQFSFTAQDVGGSGVKEIRCKLDRQSYQVCPNSMNKINLSDGSHTILAKSVDNAGNESEEISHTWSVDRSLPTVSITSSPRSPTKESSATFTFRASDRRGQVSHVECQLDGGAFEVCQDTKTYAGLSDGEHTFSVRAEDRAGNLSQVQTHTWVVDATAPEIQFSEVPDSTVYIGKTAKIQFNASDNGSGVRSVRCVFNGSNRSCSNNVGVFLSASKTRQNTFQIIVSDNVGNETTESLNWQTKIEAAAQQIDKEVLDEVPIDILFVVDTSGSMNRERTNLATKIDGFINQINDMNWQIAATTANISDNREHTKGKLTDFNYDVNNDTDPDNDLAVTQILDSNMDVDDSQDLFGARIDGTGGFQNGGDSKEAGIHAAYMAIDSYKKNEDPHTRFFREGAHLAIVVLSDEQAQGSYSPRQFLNFVNTSFNNKTVAWHSIVNRSGTKYKELSRLTNGIIGDVSASNYTNELENMGRAVKDLQKEVALGCTPLDDDLDGNIDMEVKFKGPQENSFQTYSGTYTIQTEKQRLVFDQYPETGEYQFHFNCAKE